MAPSADHIDPHARTRPALRAGPGRTATVTEASSADGSPLARLVQHLAEADRELIALRDFRQLDWDVVASRLGCSRQDAIRGYARARVALACALRSDGFGA